MIEYDCSSHLSLPLKQLKLGVPRPEVPFPALDSESRELQRMTAVSRTRRARCRWMLELSCFS